MSLKISPTATGQLVNKKQLAEIFGISERTFTEYQNDPSFPFVKDGQRGESNVYDTAQVFRYLLMTDQAKGKKEQSDLAIAKTEEARANAAMKSLLYHEKIGTLIHKDQAYQLLTEWARHANRQYRQSWDRFIEECASALKVDIPNDLREKHATAAADRVRDFALKLVGADAGSGGHIQATGEADD